MDQELHEHLVEETEALRKLVGEYSSEAIAGMCSAYVLRRGAFDEESTTLMSPARQLFFLLGLMLTTPEPANPKRFGRQEWEESAELLNSIYSAYALMFWPKEEDLPNLTDEWRSVREVVMPTFLHYFNTGVLASVEQVSERIRRYIVPFDAELKDEFGISASEALSVADWITKHFQRSADELQEAARAVREARIDLVHRAVVEGWSPYHLAEETRKDKTFRNLGISKMLRSFFKVSRDSLLERFGPRIADSYWALFVSRRGETTNFTYLTERNLAEEKPLFQVEEGFALCPLSNALYSAILRVSEARLNNGSSKDTFLKKRDKALESEVEQALHRIFGSTAKFYSAVFETETLQYEHDLVILWDGKLFSVEAKASPPIEPFRDPERAFTRLKRAFRSSRGIQKAFEQANRIRQQLASGSSVNFFDSDRNHIVEIRPEEVEAFYTVCVTRDDFGPLAVDLSLLLEKEEDEPYPWAVNILDLQNLIDAWQYFGWGPHRLCEYLNDRIHLNGKLFASDEMEIAGFFVQHGTLTHLVKAEADRLHLTPDYSNVFDRIYEAQHGGEPVVYAPTEPFMEDMRKLLADGPPDETLPETAPRKPINRKKQGRNELCNCGSGKKYKRCCGRSF
jgi:hypothetical protein